MKLSKAAAPAANTQSRRVLRIGDVEAILRLKRARIYELVSAGDLPPPFKLTPGGRASGWMSDTIEAYLEQRVQDGAAE